MRIRIMAVLLVMLFSYPALAREAAPTAEDPVLEARVLEIAAELRCLVCQNQTIADSHAALAVDLRNQVRDMLRRGESRQSIIDFMTARYGDFVLYRPPVRSNTWILWFGPAALLVTSMAALLIYLARRRRQPDEMFDPEVLDDELNATLDERRP